jgi:hypothetical protein
MADGSVTKAFQRQGEESRENIVAFQRATKES